MKLKKPVLIILVIVICFVFAYLKDMQSAHGQNNMLQGLLSGRQWNIRSAVIKKSTVTNNVTLILSNGDILMGEVCKFDFVSAQYDSPTVNNLVLEIPVTVENNTKTVDSEATTIKTVMKDKVVELAGYHQVTLNHEELNANGLAYVSGSLELVNKKANTDLVGTFKATVCH